MHMHMHSCILYNTEDCPFIQLIDRIFTATVFSADKDFHGSLTLKKGQPFVPSSNRRWLKRACLQDGLNGGDDWEVEGDHDKEDGPAQHRPQLPLP